MNRRASPLLLLLLLCAGPACITTIDEHASEVGEPTFDCIVPAPAGVRALGAPVSLEYPGGSLWIWEELALDDGRTVANAAARISDAEAACARGPAIAADGTGAPVSLLALTTAEALDNAARTDGKRLVLVPSGGVVVDGVGYLYYEHVVVGPGLFDAEPLGAGLCTIPAGAARCDRAAASGSTILWPPGERVLDRGGLVAGDRAVLYGCRAVASLSRLCTAAGAPLGRLADPAAYDVYNVFDGWVRPLALASPLADELGGVTVSAHDGGYLATTLDIFEARFYVRRSTSPLEGFGHRAAAFDIPRPRSPFPRGGREHASLRRDPRELVVTYETDNADAAGLHLAGFRLFGGVP